MSISSALPVTTRVDPIPGQIIAISAEADVGQSSGRAPAFEVRAAFPGTTIPRIAHLDGRIGHGVTNRVDRHDDRLRVAREFGDSIVRP
jgi:hypothetical protein